MKLSLFIPTHYGNIQHYASIFSVLQASEIPGFEVVISDNSGDDEKFNFLARFESENIRIFRGPSEFNHLFALEQTRGEYVMPIGDDDILLPSSLPSLMRQLENTPSAIGSCGIYGRSSASGYDFTSLAMLDQPYLAERMKGLLATIPYGNPLYYTITRREAARKAYKLFAEIPNVQCYHDHIVTLFFVNAGPYCLSDQPYFIYNFKNWSSVRERIDSELRHLRAHRLPPSLVLVQRLMLVVEGFFLIQSKHFSILDPRDRQQASIAWCLEWLKTWLISLSEGYFDCEEVTTCRFFPLVNDIVQRYRDRTDFDTYEMLARFADLYTEINGSGERYQQYWLNVLADLDG